MRKQFTICLLIFFFMPFITRAQTYGNEWINYSQSYYKIKIVKDGVYRIDSTTLANAGIPVSSIDPRNFQIFGRGQEQYIYVKGEQDGVFNGSDYIEFYAQHNDGFLDSLIYQNVTYQPNPYYSLFVDTATYYLTWNNSQNNRRLQESNDINFSAYSPSPYFYKLDISDYSGYYYEGKSYPVGSISTSDPEYTQTEGWFDSPFYLGASKTYSGLGSADAYTSGPAATIQTMVFGESRSGNQSPDHHLQVAYQNNSGQWMTVTDTSFYGYVANKFVYNISASQLGSSNTPVKFTSLTDAGFTYNRTAVSYITLKYPHTFNMEGATTFNMYLPDDNSQSKSLLEMTNFSASDSVRLFDLTNHKLIKVVKNGSTYEALVDNAGNEKHCYLTSDNQIINVTKLTPVTATAKFTDYSAISPDSAYIIITNKKLWPSATSYEAYRSSIAGGGFNVVLVDVAELYDQFSYGVDKDPLAIRRFADFVIHHWPSVPSNLLLLGNGWHARFYRHSANYYAQTLVPSFGNPSSDMLFTAGLNGTMYQPAIPTGRITALDNADVDAYLNKVQQYEAAPTAMWMKRILHFGGGGSASEQAQFAGYLSQFASIISGPYYGGQVYTFLKTTSSPIQLNLADSVKALINNGVSIMTFFGHAYGSGFDINIDHASAYDNTGKYPLMIANSCYAGDIFYPDSLNNTNISREFVMADQRGAIGFIASVDIGMAYPLSLYTSALYQNIGQTSYGKSIGKCMQNTIAAVQQTGANAWLENFTCLNMMLNGDPAVVINAHPLPDYAVSDSSIYFTPGNVTTEMDSFKVHVVVSNIGKATNNPVQVDVKRIFPDGSDSVYHELLPHIYYRDTITLTLPVNKIKGAGLNKFEVSVDPGNAIAELSESNNDVGGSNLLQPDVLLYITSGDIVPIYPYHFAIVPNDTITLKASTGDPFAPMHKYLFEVDTTDMFNSPFLKKQVVSGAGGVVKARPLYWSPSVFTMKDTTVYYWRVKRDTTDTINYHWQQSSFQYVKNKHGWEQAHFFQYKNDKYTYIDYNRPNRSFDYDTLGTLLTCTDYGQDPNNIYWPGMSATEYKENLTVEEYDGCSTTPAIHVVVIDPNTLIPWGTRWVDPNQNPPVTYNPTHNFGNANDGSNCRDRIEKYFIFRTNDYNQMHGMKNMLLNDVPNGDYILAYSWMQGNFQSWADPTAISAFQSLGATAIDTIPNNRPYIFFVKKGYPSTAQELVGDSATAVLNFTKQLDNNLGFGSITGPEIGPAESWDSLSWREEPLEQNSADSIRVNITGIDQSGNPTLLRSGIDPGTEGDLYLSFIDPHTYPYIELNAFDKDSVTHTPAQLKKWQVFYTPVPEVAVNPAKYFSFYSDSVQQGEKIKFKVAVENVSDLDMDSMLVTYWVVDNHNGIHYLPTQMSRKLPAGDTLITSITLSDTDYYVGMNSLWMEINPLNHPETRLEQYHFNNITKVGFFSGGDVINPLLDVTFDGVHILNDDIVSAKPNILIGLKDENKFLALNDTSDFAVYIRNVNDPVAKRVYFGPEMSFTPAVLPNNSCQIHYTPSFPVDGTYELTVEAKDRSNNLSGEDDYKIDFKVINESMITNVMNYPNPFSTSTRFVFTLTGSQLPTRFKIQIMTITGRVVREITEDELGLLHIGRNITEYAWDGKDQFGNQLANGIYLYRVITQIDGQSIQQMKTSADQYFKQGIGKMYLIR